MEDLESRVSSLEEWSKEPNLGFIDHHLNDPLIVLLFVLVLFLGGFSLGSYQQIMNLSREVNLLMHAQFDSGSKLI